MTTAREREITEIMEKNRVDYDIASDTCPACGFYPIADAALVDSGTDEEINLGFKFCRACSWAESGRADDPTQEGEG